MVDYLVAYLRVSTDTQIKHDTIDLQRQACRAFADKHSAVIVEEYVEEHGVSGGSQDRPAYQACLQRLKFDHKIDGLIVYAMDRWSRDKKASILTMLDFEELKKKVYMAQTGEIIDWTREGDDLIMQIKSWIAAKEREKIRDRLKLGRERVKANQGWNYWRRKDVDMREVDRLLKMGVPKTLIAEHMGVNRQTIYNRLKDRKPNE